MTLNYFSPGQFLMQIKAVADPGSRTFELDSQLYFLCVWPTGSAPPGSNLSSNIPPQESMISAVIWASFPVNTSPQFADIAQIQRL
jgi:hypothetical protein